MTRTMLLAVMVLTVCGNVSWAATTVQDEGDALRAAAARGRSDVVKQLLDRGADPNAKDVSGVPPLMYAAIYGHPDVVTMLLDHGAEVNATATGGVTAFGLAAAMGHASVLDVLLDYGAEINAKVQEGGVTALMAAVDSTHTDAVKVLLRRGANPNAATSDGRTPLHDAAAQGNAEIVGLLLENGADPNIAGGEWETALITAVVNPHAEIVTMLLEAGADVNATQDNGWTALANAEITGHTEIAQLLREAGATPVAWGDQTDAFDVTAVDDKPERLSGPLPQYPKILFQAGIEGTVLLGFVIDTTGRVEEESIQILRSTHKGFDAAAKEVIRQSVYRPGRIRGQTVRALVTQEIGFSVQGNHDTERSRRQRPAVTGEREITPSPRTLVLTDSAAVDELPRLLASPPLQYPDSLREIGSEAVVVLEFVIDATGHAEAASITVVESPHPASGCAGCSTGARNGGNVRVGICCARTPSEGSRIRLRRTLGDPWLHRIGSRRSVLSPTR